MSGIAVRALRLQEVEQLVDWAAIEGWNPGLGDAEAFRCADPDGFIGCFVNEELAAGISAVAYDEGFGFIGLYICQPRFRGQGFGRRVWDAGMAYLGDRTIGLDGVSEQQANYASIGFAPHYETVRWSGSPAAVPSPPQNMLPVEDGDHADLLAFDRLHFPAARETFLKTWLSPPHKAFLARDAGGIAGYAVIRGCREGFKIGPLFAAGDDIAGELLSACLASAPQELIHIDVPRYQVGFRERLVHLGFLPGFTTMRMYRGAAPDLADSGVYGITTLELG
ncbi:GNAT family N-acetyltransferase [Rhizobiaceae bacterium n13]|uniref:GNAT family N-acetyltransferase n=1 Tax=Ferirhizobium litorale TaxID=2927786 RepID=A0AAE3U168_9HYPH|nr:GNAT family N-acetyltransferase [Fererhizobium litorale]MDI7861165.1 GNAT family N-acetyltransferase [Fererhizobium litorale]MDI7921312.1 GNAT family N-acetyltransferase [Fererhizobium litorale]